MTLEQLEQTVQKFLDGLDRVRFFVADLETYVVDVMGREAFDQIGGYRTFADLIERWVEQGQLRPVKARGTNGFNPPLFRVYQRQRREDTGESINWAHLLAYYHPAIDTRYYQANPRAFERDRSFIDTIDRFLKDQDKARNFCDAPRTPKVAEMSVNERSYALFKDEKLLHSSESILRRLGLDFTHLACYPTYEPFFYFVTPYGAKYSTSERGLDILIVENKDTFYTLKKLFAAGKCTYRRSGKDDERYQFGILIYGEGKKIEKSFPYIEEIESFSPSRDGLCRHRYWYFGDIDQEGLAIFERLASRYPEYDIRPFIPFYTWLLENEADQAPKALSDQGRTTNTRLDEAAEQFTRRLPTGVREMLFTLLDEGRYIPQEALAYPQLESMLD